MPQNPELGNLITIQAIIQAHAIGLHYHEATITDPDLYLQGIADHASKFFNSLLESPTPIKTRNIALASHKLNSLAQAYPEDKLLQLMGRENLTAIIRNSVNLDGRNTPVYIFQFQKPPHPQYQYAPDQALFYNLDTRQLHILTHPSLVQLDF